MSQQAVAQFMNSAATNPALLGRIKGVATGRSPGEASEAVAALAAEEGFQFSGADALAYREQAVAGSTAGSGTDEDGILDGVRGGSGDGGYTQAQLDAMQSGLGMVGPAGTGLGVGLAVGAAQGNLGGAAIDAANDYNDTKNDVQQFFSDLFSGW